MSPYMKYLPSADLKKVTKLESNAMVGGGGHCGESNTAIP